jgi:hypothetical protein
MISILSAAASNLSDLFVILVTRVPRDAEPTPLAGQFERRLIWPDKLVTVKNCASKFGEKFRRGI